MPSTRDIRRRIKSVKNTAQITKAMQMVAASKMRRAQQAALAGRPYAELMNHVSANFNGFNDLLSIGNGSLKGLTAVNLRGIGERYTLVLLNGRRLANYAFDAFAVDLSTIPFAAIERVEILRDGASSI